MEPFTEFFSCDPIFKLVPVADWQTNILENSRTFSFTNHQKIKFVCSSSICTWLEGDSIFTYFTAWCSSFFRGYICFNGQHSPEHSTLISSVYMVWKKTKFLYFVFKTLDKCLQYRFIE